ncbi:hypothetical protein DE167_003149 [Clostridium beijerinckii]|uniref:Uncharacterized protein n=1 Tax=Clostridium beijerinckii TaxID=1520 RepID=A0AAX0AWY1_CLOBE|nr:hypothetical protein [Clostridium beijerinckii]NYC72683.1 hypothetical protein [Clostridium beijerinckii]
MAITKARTNRGIHIIILVKNKKNFYWYKEVIATNGNVTFVKKVQSANALFPIVVTVLGLLHLLF